MLPSFLQTSVRWPGIDRILPVQSLNIPVNFIGIQRTISTSQAPQVSLKQLHQTCEQATESNLLQSSSMLAHELPVRMQRHMDDMRSIRAPTRVHNIIQDYVSTSATIQNQLASLSSLPLSTRQHIQQITQTMKTQKDSLESNLLYMVSKYQKLAESPNYWSDATQVAAVDAAMHSSHLHMLGTRVLIGQHLAAWHKLSTPSTSKTSSTFFTHGSSMQSAHTASLVFNPCPIVKFIKMVSEDCRAFCIEKNSTSPEFAVTGDLNLNVTIIDSYVQFVYTEVLKNAMNALITRFGAWDVDEAEPIHVNITHDSEKFTIAVVDEGGGMDDEKLSSSFHYFKSSVERMDPRYGYSRDHGSQFQGIGVGLPLAKLYAQFMGGDAIWESDIAAGKTTVRITLPRDGFEF